MKIAATYSRFFFFVIATVLVLPFLFGWLSVLFIWTSPLVFLTSLASWSLAALSVLGIVTLVGVAARHRWYCRWICPTGFLCDNASRVSRLKLLHWLPSLGMIVAALVIMAAFLNIPAFALLDPIAIYHTFYNAFRESSLVIFLASASVLMFVVNINFISRHLWCQKLCPPGGLQDALTALRKNILGKKRRRSFDLGRRAAIGVLGGFGLGLLMKNLKSSTFNIRPPGARPDGEFQTTCVRCGNCAKACPTSIIETTLDPSDFIGLLTPAISFKNGYCLPPCTTCGAVCPSGAIRRFSKKDKKSLVMGLATIDVQHCRLTNHKECDRCQFYCEYDAIVIYNSDFGVAARPEVKEEKCVGCGACVVVCPVGAILITKVA